MALGQYPLVPCCLLRVRNSVHSRPRMHSAECAACPAGFPKSPHPPTTVRLHHVRDGNHRINCWVGKCDGCAVAARDSHGTFLCIYVFAVRMHCVYTTTTLSYRGSDVSLPIRLSTCNGEHRRTIPALARANRTLCPARMDQVIRLLHARTSRRVAEESVGEAGYGSR
jgi:hypothetical protein